MGRLDRCQWLLAGSTGVFSWACATPSALLGGHPRFPLRPHLTTRCLSPPVGRPLPQAATGPPAAAAPRLEASPLWGGGSPRSAGARWRWRWLPAPPPSCSYFDSAHFCPPTTQPNRPHRKQPSCACAPVNTPSPPSLQSPRLPTLPLLGCACRSSPAAARPPPCLLSLKASHYLQISRPLSHISSLIMRLCHAQQSTAAAATCCRWVVAIDARQGIYGQGRQQVAPARRTQGVHTGMVQRSAGTGQQKDGKD